MTVTPLRTITMTSPTVTSMNNKETKTSRISNFSVASLLADTRRSSTPPAHTAAAVIRVISESQHHIKNNNNNNNEHAMDICLVPKNLSLNHNSSSSPNSSHNNNDSCNNSIKLNDSELVESQRSHSPHSSIASDDYDDSMRDEEDDEDSIVDIEDVRNENSTNEKQAGQGGSLMPGQAPPIRPTPFSALAAAAAAWSMNNGGVPGWPGRQMQAFGPPGLFQGQPFGGQLNGGV